MREELLCIVKGLRAEVKARQSSVLGCYGDHDVTPVTRESVSEMERTAVETEEEMALPSVQTLECLREHIGDCQRCGLGASRHKLVFGVGNPKARIMFIGEGPGLMEDRQGEPFVGPAGQLLDKILASIHLSRRPSEESWKWVYIANMVKCHPMIDPSKPDKTMNDRAPVQEEMAVCAPFLMQQIRLIRPLFIVTLGAVATKALLKTSRGITALRGQWFDYTPEGTSDLTIKLLPTYHPSALLRDPGLKKFVWEDMKNLRNKLYETRDQRPKTEDHRLTQNFQLHNIVVND